MRQPRKNLVSYETLKMEGFQEDTTAESENESHSVVSDSFRPHGPYSPWNYLGQNTGVGSHSLFQGIFPTQGWDPCLLHWQAGSLPLSHQGSPILEVIGSRLWQAPSVSVLDPHLNKVQYNCVLFPTLPVCVLW